MADEKRAWAVVLGSLGGIAALITALVGVAAYMDSRADPTQPPTEAPLPTPFPTAVAPAETPPVRTAPSAPASELRPTPSVLTHVPYTVEGTFSGFNGLVSETVYVTVDGMAVGTFEVNPFTPVGGLQLRATAGAHSYEVVVVATYDLGPAQYSGAGQIDISAESRFGVWYDASGSAGLRMLP